MGTLRYTRFWYLLGAVLTLVVVVSSLVPPRDLPPTGLNDKVEHIIAYGGLALCMAGLRHWARWVEQCLIRIRRR